MELNGKKAVIGIDLSLNSTGLAFIFYDNKEEKVNTKILKIKSLRGVKRLENIKREIDQFIDKCSGIVDIDLICLEGYSFGSRGRAVFSIAELGGLIKHLLFDRKIKTVLVPPTTLKKFVTGRGNSPKNQMLLGIYKKFEKSFKDDNEADAYALAKLAEFLLENPQADLWKKVEFLA